MTAPRDYIGVTASFCCIIGIGIGSLLGPSVACVRLVRAFEDSVIIRGYGERIKVNGEIKFMWNDEIDKYDTINDIKGKDFGDKRGQ